MFLLDASSALIAAVCYFVSGHLQYHHLTGAGTRPISESSTERWLMPLVLVATALHGLHLYRTLWVAGGIHLGLFRVAALASWLMVLIVLLGGIRLRLRNLFAFVLPIAATTLILNAFIDTHYQPLHGLPLGVLSHVCISVFAFSLLGIAALQALVLAFQNHQLKAHHTRGLLATLPPLETMEVLLFRVIGAGFVTLTAAILTGAVFIEDMFAQHLLHKTFFTLLAWLVFALLLVGRRVLGWRGTTAIRWTIAGFAVLALGIFGSKLALEVLLQTQA